MSIGAFPFPSEEAENPNSGGGYILEIPMPDVDRIIRSVLPSDVVVEESTKLLLESFVVDFIRHILRQATLHAELQGRSLVTYDDIAHAVRMFELKAQADHEPHNGPRAVVPPQHPAAGNAAANVPVAVPVAVPADPMAPGTPPPPNAAAGYRPSLLGGGLSADEGSDGSDDHETNKGTFSG